MGTTDNPEEQKLVGYILRRSDCPGGLFLGVTPNEVADAFKTELENQDNLPASEMSVFTIEPIETTLTEILSMPEFEGW
jgi:hypothetical protein